MTVFSFISLFLMVNCRVLLSRLAVILDFNDRDVNLFVVFRPPRRYNDHYCFFFFVFIMIFFYFIV